MAEGPKQIKLEYGTVNSFDKLTAHTPGRVLFATDEDSGQAYLYLDSKDQYLNIVPEIFRKVKVEYSKDKDGNEVVTIF